jgi:hypothetical protein
MLSDQFPVHRFFHTVIGASLGAALTVVLFLAARALASRIPLPNVLGWRELTLVPVLLGAAAGTYSHVALDSIMHDDIAPLAPFSDANPLLHLVSLATLHWTCAGLGAVALVVLLVRDVS